MFSQLMRDLEGAGRQLERGADSLAKSATKTIDENWSSAVLDLFRHGNVVQLFSHKSGRALEIVQGANGLMVDANGVDVPNMYNAYWTVSAFGKNTVALNNQTNYLAIRDGVTQVFNVANPTTLGADCKFRLVQKNNMIVLESLQDERCHIGVTPDGSLKSAVASGKDMDSWFGVKLIYSPHPQATQPVVVQQQVRK